MSSAQTGWRSPARTAGWAVVALIFLAATGCGSGSDGDGSAGPTTTAAPPPPAAPVEAVGAVTHGALAVGGRERTFRLYVPARLPAGPVPLLVGLHGGTGWGDQFAAATGVEGWAEANGFIVVHPDGVPVGRTRGGVWNGGVCCGVAAREEVDDVAFVAALLDRLSQEHDIDPARTFAFGHSNGGIMSYRLACELGDLIAAVGVVAGTLGVATCDPAQPVSVLHIHGTADENLPITGGTGARSVAGVDFPSPVDGFARVAGAEGCPEPEKTTDGDVTTAVRAACDSGATATFVTIAGAQHPWPGPRRGRRRARASPMPATTPRRRSWRSCSSTPGREPRRPCGLHSCSDQACSGGEGSLGEQPPGPSGDDDPFAIDTDTATPARVLNYLAGGDVNFAADRELAEQLGDALPGGIDTARAAVRTLSAFMGRAVRFLAGEAGIAQFVNVGAGVPTVKKVHEVAQQAAPGSRFVYVGDDPVVLAHAHTLRSSTGGNVSTYVDGNLRSPQAIIRQARETLDFDEPVAVLLLTTLNFIPDEDDPYGLVAELLEPLPAGSCLAIAHASFDLGDEGMHKAAERLDKAIRQDYVVRSRDEIARFFDGLELAHPGLVQIDSWRPDGRPSPAPQDRPTPVYAGVGRRP